MTTTRRLRLPLQGGDAARAGATWPVPPSLVRAVERGDLAPEHAWLGWELAQLPGVAPDEGAARGVAVLGAMLAAAVADGSSRLDLGPTSVAARATGWDLDAADAGAAARAAEALRGAAGHPLIAAGLVEVRDDALQAARVARLEARVAAALRARHGKPAPTLPTRRAAERALLDVAAAPPVVRGAPVKLTDEQSEAVLRAVTSPLTVVTGGPGTGKTSVVVSILRVLAHLDPEGVEGVRLAAPTGRAADRMRASVGEALERVERPGLGDLALLRAAPTGRTLHRLLRIDPDTQRAGRHAGAPLDAHTVVVDETSMADLGLVDALLDALPPAARLVLLGDADQLPSVELGAVLRDLVDAWSMTPHVVRLQRSFRMDPADPAGRHVLSVARRVRRGDEALTRRTMPGGRGGDDPEPIPGVDPSDGRDGVALVEATTPRARARAVEAWAERQGGHLARHVDPDAYRLPDGAVAPGRPLSGEAVARLEAWFEARARAQVLAVRRDSAGLDGVLGFNAWMHRRRGGDPRDPDRLLPGEPVLAVRNDYLRGVFNGDPGLVVAWRGEGRERDGVAFRRAGGFVVFPVGAVRSLVDLAYATTVHKAQGSEYDRVLLLLPDGPSRLLGREVLYTALTRARKAVTLVGDPALWRDGVRGRLERSTGLGDLLG